MSARTKAYLLLLLTAIIWGIASPVIKYTLKFVEPFTFLFWRFLLTCLVLTPTLLIYLKRKKTKLNLKLILKLSLLGSIGTTLCLSLLFIGYKYTTAIDGTLIYSISPIIVVAGGALLLKEEVTCKEKLGAFIAFTGSIVTIIQPLMENKAFAIKNLYGNILIFASAVSWASYCLLVRKFEAKDKTDPFILTAIGFIAGFITIIPFFLYESFAVNDYLKSINLPTQSLFHLNKASLPGILYMSLLSSVIAYFTYNLGYSLIEASEATIFDYLKPIFAIPIAVFWLHEKTTLSFLAGASLIFLGVFLTEHKTKKELKQKS